MQCAVAGESIDRDDRAVVGLHREHGARLHGGPVEVDRARAALRRVAADLRPGQAEPLAQEVDEERARLDLCLAARAVDGDGDRWKVRTSFVSSGDARLQDAEARLVGRALAPEV